MTNPLRLFVSSPSDVPAERIAVERVATRVAAQFEGIEIKVTRWESGRYYSAHSGFQEQIDEIGNFDLVVGILWSRLGTPLPPGFGLGMPTPRKGQPYPSGTAFEILEAIRLRKERAAPPPEILVYRKLAPTPSAKADDDAAQEELLVQRRAVNEFFRDFFANETEGYKGAFQTFENLDGFEARFEQDLIAWLRDDGRLGRQRRWRIEDPERGCPFVGLNAFGPKHRDVFFGRRADIERARERLESGNGFLLIDGASGTGKSSLVRAGLLPRLQDLDPDLRIAVTVPETADPLAALAHALFDKAALPELAQSDYSDPAALARHFAGGGDAAPVLRALERAAKALTETERRDSPAELRLVLVVDQCEAIFTNRVSPDTRASFAGLIAGFVDSSRIRVIATLRANAREAALELPALSRLINGQMGLSLEPPGLDATAEIIRGPAEAAALVFERDAAGVGLDEVMLRDVENDPAALPLLQFALEKLYEAAVERVSETGARLGDVPAESPVLTLTHSDYRALGGIAGAIGHQAEAALKNCSETARSRLAPLVRSLTEAGTGAFVLARAPIEQVAPDAETQELADALIAARIIIQNSERESEIGRTVTTLRFSHERVLTAWERARDAVRAAAGYLRVRADLIRAEARWNEASRKSDLLLPTGIRLAEAEDAVRKFGQELDRQDPRLREYVRMSTRYARRSIRRIQAAAAVFAAMAFAAGWFAYQSDQNARLADTNEERALENEATAIANAQAAAAASQTAEDNARRAEQQTRRAQDALVLVQSERDRAEEERATAERQRALAERQSILADAAAGRSRLVASAAIGTQVIESLARDDVLRASTLLSQLTQTDDSEHSLRQLDEIVATAQMMAIARRDEINEVSGVPSPQFLFPNNGNDTFAYRSADGSVHIIDGKNSQIIASIPSSYQGIGNLAVSYSSNQSLIRIADGESNTLTTYDIRSGNTERASIVSVGGLSIESVSEVSGSEAVLVRSELNGRSYADLVTGNGKSEPAYVKINGGDCVVIGARQLHTQTNLGTAEVPVRYYYCPHQSNIVRQVGSALDAEFDLTPVGHIAPSASLGDLKFLGTPKLERCRDERHYVVISSGIASRTGSKGRAFLYNRDGTFVRSLNLSRSSTQVMCYDADNIFVAYSDSSLEKICPREALGCQRPLVSEESNSGWGTVYHFGTDSVFWTVGSAGQESLMRRRIDALDPPMIQNLALEVSPIVVNIDARPYLVAPVAENYPSALILVGNDNVPRQVPLDLVSHGLEGYTVDRYRGIMDYRDSEVLVLLRPPPQEDRANDLAYCQRLAVVTIPQGSISRLEGYDGSTCASLGVSYHSAKFGSAPGEIIAVSSTEAGGAELHLVRFSTHELMSDLATFDGLSPEIFVDTASDTIALCSRERVAAYNMMGGLLFEDFGGTSSKPFRCDLFDNSVFMYSGGDEESITAFNILEGREAFSSPIPFVTLRSFAYLSDRDTVVMSGSTSNGTHSIPGQSNIIALPGSLVSQVDGLVSGQPFNGTHLITVDQSSGFYLSDIGVGEPIHFNTGERYDYVSWAGGDRIVALTTDRLVRIFDLAGIEIDAIKRATRVTDIDPSNDEAFSRWLRLKALHVLSTSMGSETLDRSLLCDEILKRVSEREEYFPASSQVVVATIWFNYSCVHSLARIAEWDRAMSSALRMAHASEQLDGRELREVMSLLVDGIGLTMRQEPIDEGLVRGVVGPMLRAGRLILLDEERQATSGIARLLGSLSYRSLFFRMDTEARDLSLVALELDSDLTWIAGNLAHAYMFLGEMEQALEVHRSNFEADMGPGFGQGVTWSSLVIDDFAAFRLAGREHRGMAEIEAILSRGGFQ